MSSSNSQEILCIPPELRVLAKNVAPAIEIEEILRGRVWQFVEWKKNKAITLENSLLVYFNEINAIQGESGGFGEIQGDSRRIREIQGESGRFRGIQGESGWFKENQRDSGRVRKV